MRALVCVVPVLALALGCSSGEKSAEPEKPDYSSTAGLDLERALANARSSHKPLVVEVFADSNRGSLPTRVPFDLSIPVGDPDVRVKLAEFELCQASSKTFDADRFHVVAPALVYLSSKGVIIGRDEGELTKDALLKSLDQAKSAGRELDIELASLEARLADSLDGNGPRRDLDVTANRALADFYIAHQNWSEAHLPLRIIANSGNAPPPMRVRAFVDIGRGLLWVGDSEGARGYADELEKGLGKTTPDAVAGARLIQGEIEAEANRKDEALKKLDEAVRASPDSVYGKRAKQERERLESEKK